MKKRVRKQPVIIVKQKTVRHQLPRYRRVRITSNTHRQPVLHGRGLGDWVKHALNYAKTNRWLSSTLGALGGLGLASGNPYGQVAGVVANGASNLAHSFGYGAPRRGRGIAGAVALRMRPETMAWNKIGVYA